MNAEQYRELLTKLEISQERMAKLIGVGKRTSQGYALGDHIPDPTAILLWLLHAGKITVDDVERTMRRKMK
jgi:transcriptional regulator with XRE-family HTH domain